MILEAYMPVYIGVKIFIAYGCTGRRAGPPEVVQEALADLKSAPMSYMVTISPQVQAIYFRFCYFYVICCKL